MFSCDNAGPGSVLARRDSLNNIFHFHMSYMLPGFINFNLQQENLILNTCGLARHMTTAVGQVVACVPVMQRARVRSPVGTSFLGEAFSWFFLTCKTNVRKL